MAIYKTRNTGTGNGMWGMREKRGMFSRIPGNLLEDSEEYYYFNIPRNDQEDSGKSSRGFRGMFEKIPGNVNKNSGKCSRRFRGMFVKIPENVQEDSGGKFKKIPGNLNLDLFCEILLIFHQILQLNCDKTKKYFLGDYLLLTTNLLRLKLSFSQNIYFFVLIIRSKSKYNSIQIQNRVATTFLVLLNVQFHFNYQLSRISYHALLHRSALSNF